MNNTFYITTPIYYANSSPHLGHLYSTIVADVIARWKRQCGSDTYFLTGTDEHGINIQRAAEKAGRTPKEQVDLISAEIRRLFEDFRIDTANGGYDQFMRTSEPFHYEGAGHFWKEIAKNRTPKGNETIYKGFYEGWFCAPCAAFKFEDEYSQPEGSDVPVCLIHERPLDRVSEESYFFRLSDYQEYLIELIENNEELIRPESRRNEVLAFIRTGLQDLSISREKRSVSWGIPVPGDEKHIMYVWLDALSNYLTAIGYGNTQRADVGFEKYWKNVTHLVGKDILRFHTVYWFSFLHAAGLSLPKMVYAHGMWLDAEGRKMGKTLGNVIEVSVLQQYFQVDAIRYFLLREMVFGQDGRFGYESLIDRVNGDLAGGLGNLASRTFSMIEKYRGGKVPAGQIAEENYLKAKRAGINPDEQELVSALDHARNEFVRHFDRFDFSLALESVWSMISRVDKMISDSKPWELIKDETQAEILNAVLYRSAETLRWISVLVQSVMPAAANEIYRQIGLSLDITKIDPRSLKWGELPPDTAIGEVNGVFPRVDKKKIMSEINEKAAETPAEEKKETVAAEAAVETIENFITIDDFLKVELRVGEVKVAERIPNADKLLRFEIDLGEEKPRQILAGLAQYYDPEKLIGRKVVVVANLKPRKMRGLESQGMICAASLEDDSGPNPALASFLEDVEIGARLK